MPLTLVDIDIPCNGRNALPKFLTPCHWILLLLHCWQYMNYLRTSFLSSEF